MKHYPTPDLLHTTAEKLKWYRLKNGYTQAEVAKMIGVHRSTYIHYEEPSHRLFKLDKLESVANVYKIETEELF